MISNDPNNLNVNQQIDKERLASLINSMTDGVIAIDEECRIVISNGAALNLLDSNKPLSGVAIGSVLNLLDKDDNIIDLRKQILDTKTSTTSRDWRLKYSDGEVINLYVSVSPVRLGYGVDGMKGFVLLLRDITREKSLEEERDEFISVVSHELRTPVAIAEGNVSNAMFLLQKKSDLPVEIEALKQAYNQITYLAGMINDLSTLSRAERGILDIEVESINVGDLINELVSAYRDDALKKHLDLNIHLDPKLEILQSCRLYVYEILQNFITNAIKYTDTGNIVVGAIAKDNSVEFYVQDTGIGISHTDKVKVFDKFYRGEDYRIKDTDGTGLGLYVTTKLAKLINASITMSSEVNKGSTFAVLVPNIT